MREYAPTIDADRRVRVLDDSQHADLRKFLATAFKGVKPPPKDAKKPPAP